MARRDREINIFNIAFLDVITGAMGAFVLLVLLLAPYYNGSAPRSQAKQQAAQSAVNDAQQNVQKAQQSVPQNDQQARQALDQAKADLDQAKQQLDALKQQIDQLDSQNHRLSALDDQQQQQVAQLQQQAEQSTKQTLDRAEQNMQQADQAIQSGNVEELKRLLAQARADLAAARQQLDTLDKELDQANATIADLRKELADAQAALNAARDRIGTLTSQLQQAQQALVQAQAQRNQAIAQAQQAEQQLKGALQQRDQAFAEATAAKQVAAGLKQTVDQSEPVPAGSTLIDITAEPACGNVAFHAATVPRLPDRPPTPAGITTVQERNDYFARSSNLVEFPSSQSGPFHVRYILNIPFPGMRFLFGIGAQTMPPPGCRVALGFDYSQPTKTGGAQALSWHFAPAVSSTGLILVSAIPPTGQSAAPTPDDVATWNRITQAGGGQR